MTAIAKNWLKYNEKWIAPGEAFEVDGTDAAGIAEYADLTVEEQKPVEPKPRASRKKKV